MGMKITKFVGFLKINTRTRACLIPNPNREIRKKQEKQNQEHKKCKTIIQQGFIAKK